MHYLRMFPLGSVPFPGGIIPLQVFEARYLQMITECMDEGTGFGIVLIERGHEVGGGDERFGTGTHVVIDQLRHHPDGRMSITCRGTHRIRVVEWLSDDPYPHARVEVIEEPEVGSLDLEPAKRAIERLIALASELGYDTGDLSLEVPDDPVEGLYWLCHIAPLGPLDSLHLLEAPDAAVRFTMLMEMLADQEALLRARLAAG